MLKNMSAEEQLYTQLAEMIEKEKDNEAFSLPSIADIKASGFSPAAIRKAYKRLCEKKLIVKAGKRYTLPGKINLADAWMTLSPLQAQPIVFITEGGAKEYAKTKRGITIEPCKIAIT